MKMPLEGIRVLDFGQVGACPVCGVILANLGADVIKVEKPQGESMRRGKPEGIPWRLENEEGLDDPPWMAFNQGKRAVAVDLKKEKGREFVNRLIETSDVFIHNFRPKGIQKMGLDYESVACINPDIVYMNLYAYGDQGPMRNWAGGDAWIQGFAGVVALQGLPDGSPYLAGPGIADLSGALWGVISVLAGLMARERGGVGQELTTSLFGATMYLQLAEYTDYLIGGKLNKKVGRGYRGSFPYGAYKAKDGDIVTFYGAEESWETVCKLIGLDELLNNPRYDSQEKREKFKGELYPLLDQAFSKKTRAEWQQIFREAGLRVDPALDHAEVVEHPQTKVNDMIVDLEHPQHGNIKMLNIPLKMNKIARKKPLPPPLLGQHTREIAQELNYPEDEIETLILERVLRTSN